MIHDQSIAEIVELMTRVSSRTDAMFGYVFEVNPEKTRTVHAHWLVGRLTNDAILNKYCDLVGGQAMELARSSIDGTAHLVPAAKDTPTLWHTANITQGIMNGVCISLVYRYYGSDEAERVLQLLRLVVAERWTKPRGK